MLNQRLGVRYCSRISVSPMTLHHCQENRYHTPVAIRVLPYYNTILAGWEAWAR